MTSPQIPDGDPVDMSQVTLGPRYSLQDMYRDMGIEPPAPADMPYVDTVRTVTVHVGEGEGKS